MSDNQTPPDPQRSGDEPSLGGKTAPHLTGFEPRLGSYLPITLTGLSALAQVRMAEALARTGSQPAKQMLYRALLEGDETVSQAAAQVLGRLKDPGALEVFSRVIQNTDFGTLIRAAVLRAAGQIGGREGLSVLLDAENDPDPTVREARVRALGNLGARLEDEDSQLRTHVLEALQTAFDDDNPTVREVSVVMIGWVGGEESRAILLSALTNPHFEVARAAARLLPLDNETQGQQTYLQNLRRYRSAFRQAYQLAAWLVRDAGRPNLIQTLILALMVGVALYFIDRFVLNTDALTRIFWDTFASIFILGGFCMSIWLLSTAVQATDEHRLNEQLAVIRITELKKSIIFISYILAGLHRARVGFVLMTSVLLAWLVSGNELQLWLIAFVCFGLGVLMVPLGTVVPLTPRRVRPIPRFTKGTAVFILLGIFLCIMIWLLWDILF